MGRVNIRDLQVDALIGTLPEEQVRRQRIVLDIAFDFDAVQAEASDDLRASVDYSAVEKIAAKTAETSRCALLEALAAKLAEAILAFDRRILRVAVTVAKPAASAYGARISYSAEFPRGRA